jgi:hypothetical protein
MSDLREWLSLEFALGIALRPSGASNQILWAICGGTRQSVGSSFVRCRFDLAPS